MKIKLAVLEKDVNYLNRFVTSLNIRYPDKLEIYSFTDYKTVIDILDNSKIDVLLASDTFEVETSKLPKRCGFAYFVDSSDIDAVYGQMAICKFQKIDLIYRQILSLYSENTSNISGIRFEEDNCKVIEFVSISGGSGSSTMAAACAMSFAKKRKKTLYVNLEMLGSTNIFFDNEGQYDMSDIIYALKSKKSNITLKLESCVRQSDGGIYYFAKPKVALDMLELDTDEIIRMISELKFSCNYDYIIIDLDFGLSKEFLGIYRQAYSIVLVGDGTDVSNTKILSACQSLEKLEQGTDISVLNRMCIIYNKFSNKTGKLVESIGLKMLGGAPRFEHATPKQIAEQLSMMDIFEELM